MEDPCVWYSQPPFGSNPFQSALADGATCAHASPLSNPPQEKEVERQAAVHPTIEQEKQKKCLFVPKLQAQKNRKGVRTEVLSSVTRRTNLKDSYTPHALSTKSKSPFNTAEHVRFEKHSLPSKGFRSTFAMNT